MNLPKPDEYAEYYSGYMKNIYDDNIIKVHRLTCSNVTTVEDSRLLNLTWAEILLCEKAFVPDAKIWQQLDEIDFSILM